jgi:hypothetical protein
VRNAAFVHCVGRKLMGCYGGGNLNCNKADTRRTLPERFCLSRQLRSQPMPAAWIDRSLPTARLAIDDCGISASFHNLHDRGLVRPSASHRRGQALMFGSAHKGGPG